MKKDTIQYDDFLKLDIRVGEVTSAEQLPKSKKLIKLTVDLGEEYGVVQILTAMAEFHAPETFVGNKYYFLANLEPRKMMGEFSNGMILSPDLDNKPVLCPVDNNIKNGTIVR